MLTPTYDRVAHVVYQFLQLALIFQISRTLGMTSEFKATLECEPDLYPIEWLVLFICDFATGFFSIIIYFIFHQRTDDLGAKEHEAQLERIKLHVAENFNCPEMSQAPNTLAVVDFCTQVRDIIVMQMKLQAFWTQFFGFFEILLYIVGDFILPPPDAEKAPVICEHQVIWTETDTLGSMFMSAHCFVLTFSAITIIRNFYILPKNKGLLVEFKFNKNPQGSDDDTIENYSRSSSIMIETNESKNITSDQEGKNSPLLNHDANTTSINSSDK